MADVGHRGLAQGLLVDRGGGQGVRLTGLQQLHGPLDEGVGGSARALLHLSEGRFLGADVAQVHQVQRPGGKEGVLGVVRHVQAQVRARHVQGSLHTAPLAHRQRTA